jgi:tricarballylate dehydrogenase
VLHEQRTETVRPRAVVASCGGYQANVQQLARVWGSAAERFVVRGSPHAAGEVLLSLTDQGVATVGSPAAGHLVAVDARSPQYDGGIVTRALGIPAGIVVDRDGKRFHDEAADIGPTRYAVWGRLLARCPGQIGYLILDATAQARVRPSVFPPLQAATIPELATRIGLDPTSLQATVTGFNAAIEGQATQGLSPPKTRQAWPLALPPFSAIPMRPGITFTCHGLRVDAQARVLLGNGHPTENLFAAGILMAPNVLGTGYLAGVAMTNGTVFGRIAGTEAARLARR